MIARVVHHASERAIALRKSLEQRLGVLMLGWIALAGAASLARISKASIDATSPSLAAIFPYLLMVAAPVASLALALQWFARSERHGQPRLRLARIGRWRDVSRVEAQGHRLYGADGLMVSLLLGILFNIPFRAMEYLGAMPVIAGDVPPWLAVLRFSMTADLVLMTSLYAIAFGAALRRAPIFPRLLCVVWIVDLLMQVVIAQLVAAEPTLPAKVGVALGQLLKTNVVKIGISMALWLPYLLLSKRVNVTYRLRVEA